jgi:hypothetical protein
MLTHSTSSLDELYWRLEQINGAIAALERIQRARAQRSRPLPLLRDRRRARLLHFHRPSKKPECATALPSISMSA